MGSLARLPAGTSAATCNVNGYVFDGCRTISGASIGRAPAGKNATELAELCGRTPGCVAFTSAGELKYKASELKDMGDCRPGGWSAGWLVAGGG